MRDAPVRVAGGFKPGEWVREIGVGGEWHRWGKVRRITPTGRVSVWWWGRHENGEPVAIDTGHDWSTATVPVLLARFTPPAEVVRDA